MPRFISKSGSFEDLIVSGSRLYVASSSIFFNNLATSSTTISNVLVISSSGQIYYTASSALPSTTQTFNTSSFITTGSISTTQSITGSLGISGSNITITGSVNITGSLNATASWAVSASQAISSSYATTASYALNGGSGTTFYIATGSVTASVNVVTSSIFQITSGSSTFMIINNSGSIGIGTTTPSVYSTLSSSAALHIKSRITIFEGEGTGSAGTLFTNNGGRTFITMDSSDFVAYTDNQGKLPQKWLHVSNGFYNNPPLLRLDGNLSVIPVWSFNYSASSNPDHRGVVNVRSDANYNFATAVYTRTNTVSQWNKENGDGFYSGSLFIGTGSVDKGYKLMVSGSDISGSFNANNVLYVSGSTVSISGSFTVVSGSTEFQVQSTGIKMGNSSSDAHIMTGSFRISGTGNTGSILTVIGSGSTNPIFLVQGSQGELFSVTDSLTGSLFSVNDISGLPILDVNSDQTVKIGTYLAPGLYASARVTANTGETVIYSIPTASYDSAYFDYNIRSGSVGRAGSIIAMWSGSSVNYSEVSASSFGTTDTVVLGASISGSNMILSGSAPSNGWTVKTIIRSI